MSNIKERIRERRAGILATAAVVAAVTMGGEARGVNNVVEAAPVPQKVFSTVLESGCREAAADINVPIEGRLVGNVWRFDDAWLVVEEDGTCTFRSRTEGNTDEERRAWENGEYDWKGNLVEISNGVFATPWNEAEGIGIDGQGRADRRVLQVLTDSEGNPITKSRNGVTLIAVSHYNQALSLVVERGNPTGLR